MKSIHVRCRQILILVVALVVVLGACSRSPDPISLVNAWAQALNDGDVAKALSYLTDDAVVTIIPAPPGGTGVFTGREQIQAWYELIAGAHGIGTMTGCKVAGNQMTCLDTYTDDDLKGMGVDFIEGEWVATLQNGKFKGYTMTMTPESLAKLAPPP